MIHKTELVATAFRCSRAELGSFKKAAFDAGLTLNEFLVAAANLLVMSDLDEQKQQLVFKYLADRFSKSMKHFSEVLERKRSADELKRKRSA